MTDEIAGFYITMLKHIDHLTQKHVEDYFIMFRRGGPIKTPIHFTRICNFFNKNSIKLI